MSKQPITAIPQERQKTAKYHAEVISQLAQHKYDVLLLGDSLTEHWKDQGAQAWRESGLEASKRKILNAGVGGDRTQHVLWRIEEGLFKSFQPAIVVLLIGTNNISGDGDRPEDVQKGVASILRRIRRESPGSTIVLCSIPPMRGPGGGKNAQIVELNTLLAKLAGDQIKFWAWDKELRLPDGGGAPEFFIDQLHLSPKGYASWAAQLVLLLAQH